MTLRRKLAVTTIAASVAMSAFAGIPLSNKGLAEKLGLSGVAYAAGASFPNSTVTTKVTQLRNALIATNGIGAVRNLRNAINAIPDATKGDIAQPIVEKFMKDIDEEDQADKIDTLKEIFVNALSLTYDPDLTELEALRVAYNEELSEYASNAGVSNLTIDDIVSYFLLAQEEVIKILDSKSSSELLDLLTDPAGFNTLFEQALANMSGTYAVKTVFLYYEVTTEDVTETISALKAAVGANNIFRDAALALYDAYQELKDDDTPPVTIPTNPVTPGIDIPAEVKDLENKLGELKDKLANATDEEKAELIAEAVKEAQAVVDKLSNIEASVTVVDGKATLQLDDKKALSAIAGIAAAATALKDATGEEIKSLKVKIDLGKVEQAEVAVGLSTAVVEEAIKANLAAVAFVIDDLTIELPVGGQFNQAVDLTVNRSEATPEVTGGLNAASDVYDFSVSIGGTVTNVFTKPVLIQLPVSVSSDIDTDLLTLAKIIEEKLAFYGGRYSQGTFTEARDSFSSYVVVENKVSFDDTASVDEWAGRAIEVIAAKGAINGKAEGVFDPSANVTRAEFAKMLVHALDLDNQTAKEGFADVNTGDWFAPYVAAASEKGIINGRSATKFDPTAKITRAEMATMVTRALKYAHGTADVEDLEEALAAFSDAGQISSALAQGVAFAANYGIVVGNEGKFAPNANATRAQAAVIIYRAFNFEE